MLVVALVLALVTVVAVVLAMRERGARQRLDAELSQLAHHDRLTGLPNRSVLEAWVSD